MTERCQCADPLCPRCFPWRTRDLAKAECERDAREFEEANAGPPCEYCGADRMDGCNCHEDITGFPENGPRD